MYSGISGLIILMLAVIGWLIRTGFDGLRRELKAIWDKLEGHQKETAEVKVSMAEMRTRCEERHTTRENTGRRFDD